MKIIWKGLQIFKITCKGDNKTCCIRGKMFESKCANCKIYCKIIVYHCHRTGEYRSTAHIIYYLRYSILIEVLVNFQNRSNYDYHFIVNDLESSFLRENTEKWKTLSVLMKKQRKKNR